MSNTRSGNRTKTAAIGARHRYARSYLVAGIAFTVLFLLTVGDAWAGGGRERRDRENEAPAAAPAPERATGPLSGVVTSVETASDGALILTVRQPDDARVTVDVPAALARSIRVQEGDRIRTTEHEMAEDGARLRVQRFEIDR